MSDTLRVLQVFIASPNDLIDERRAIKEVADELNLAFGRITGVQIQLLGWEDRLPGFGRPQGQINEDVDKADLFIGFLWRRWGSDAGNPKYTSGFEEEFERAVERREKTGSPEISLFFKGVTITSVNNLDDQLKRVLEFKDSVASKKVLFATFTSDEEWKKKTWTLLHAHLLKLLKSTIEQQGKDQPQAPPTPLPDQTETNATAQQDTTSTSAAKYQVTRAWNEALEAIKLGHLSELSTPKGLDKLTVARIGLATAGITNRDIETNMPGVHLINLLFKNRKKIELTRVEWLLALRMNLIPQAGYHPGWYWIRKTTVKIKGLLLWLAWRDGDTRVRHAALQYASRLNISLHVRTRQGTFIELLCNHNEPVTRKAAAEYLTEKGREEDLPLVEKLRTDTDGDVRGQAELARTSILLRIGATDFFETSILTGPWASDDVLTALQGHIAEIQPDVLRKGLSHPDSKIQTFVAKELAGRGLLTSDDIDGLNIREELPEVRRAYLLRVIATGHRVPIELVHDALKPSGLYIGELLGPTVKADDVVAELFKLYSYDELLTIAGADSPDAPVAYRALADRYFERFGEKVRDDLKSDFAVLRSRSKASEAASTGLGFSLRLFGAWRPDIADFTVVALSALANAGSISDRELVRPFLDSKTERIRIAAVTALRRVGQPQDKDMLLRIAEAATAELAVEAAKTALILAPGETGSAGSLLKSSKPALVKLAILSLINLDPKYVWPNLQDRLYDEDDEIRQLTCAYVVKKFSLRRLVKLLEAYLARDRYFYNVTYFLDRAIYAPPPFRKVFTEEILKVLD